MSLALRAKDSLAALLPDPSPPGQFRASVIYRRNSANIGRDEIAVTVVDGWLHGEGVRSHFALRREDVLGVVSKSNHFARLCLPGSEEILLQGLTAPSIESLKAWQSDPHRMEGEPTFPPAEVRQEENARRVLYIATGLLLRHASAYFRPGTHLLEGWVRTAVHELLWAAGVVLIGIGVGQVWRLLTLGQASREQNRRPVVSSSLGLARTIETDPAEVRVARAE